MPKPTFFPLLDKVIELAASIASKDPFRVDGDSPLTGDPLFLTDGNLAELAQQLDDTYGMYGLKIGKQDLEKVTYIIEVADLVAKAIDVTIPNSGMDAAVAAVNKVATAQAGKLNLDLLPQHLDRIGNAVRYAYSLAATKKSRIDALAAVAHRDGDVLIRARQHKRKAKAKP